MHNFFKPAATCRIIAIFACVLAVACGQPAQKAETSQSAPQPQSAAPTQAEPDSGIPRVGQPAPDFSVPASTGHDIALADYKGQRNVVLYFYPMDDTPGCTAEACSFRDNMAEFDQRDASILGVSGDDLKSHDQFIGKFSLPFPLLADTEYEIMEKYGAKLEEEEDGETFVIAKRMTFIIDKQGIVRSVFPDVRVDGHTEEVLAALDAIQE